MGVIDLVPVGRIGRCLKGDDYKVTYKGDGLVNLGLPTELWLCKTDSLSENQTGILEFCRKGYQIHKSTSLLGKVKVVKMWARTAQASHIHLQVIKSIDALTPDMVTESALDLKGLWLCIEKARLIEHSKSAEPYLFQLLGLYVFSRGRKVATVTDYFETGAHPVLVTSILEEAKYKDKSSFEQTEEQGKEIMLPFTTEHVHLADSLSHVEVPDFQTFVEANQV